MQRRAGRECFGVGDVAAPIIVTTIHLLCTYMNKAYLLTGSNMGDRLSNLTTAIHAITKNCGEIITQSSIYQTAAWGNENQPDFLNQAILIDTRLKPLELLQVLLSIEKKIGRIRNKKNDPRTIDIDVLFYNDLILDTAELQVPHPRLHLRRFVLVPLNEVAPHLIHPVLHQPIQELLNKCPDKLNVKKFSSKLNADY